MNLTGINKVSGDVTGISEMIKDNSPVDEVDIVINVSLSLV